MAVVGQERKMKFLHSFMSHQIIANNCHVVILLARRTPLAKIDDDSDKERKGWFRNESTHTKCIHLYISLITCTNICVCIRTQARAYTHSHPHTSIYMVHIGRDRNKAIKSRARVQSLQIVGHTLGREFGERRRNPVGSHSYRKLTGHADAGIAVCFFHRFRYDLPFRRACARAHVRCFIVHVWARVSDT